MIRKSSVILKPYIFNLASKTLSSGRDICIVIGGLKGVHVNRSLRNPSQGRIEAVFYSQWSIGEQLNLTKSSSSRSLRPLFSVHSFIHSAPSLFDRQTIPTHILPIPGVLPSAPLTETWKSNIHIWSITRRDFRMHGQIRLRLNHTAYHYFKSKTFDITIALEAIKPLE